MYIYMCMSFSKFSKRYDFLLNLHLTVSKIKNYPHFIGYWAVQVWLAVQHDKLYILSPRILFIILVYDNSLPCGKYFNVYEPPANILFLHNTFYFSKCFYMLSFWIPLPVLQPSVTASVFTAEETNWKEIVKFVGSNVAVRESGHVKLFPVPREWGPRKMAHRVVFTTRMLEVLGLQTVGKEAGVGCEEGELTFGWAAVQVAVG